MAARLLLPGYGGKYTSEAIAFGGAVGQDTIDCSRCAQLLFEVVSHTGDATGVTIQQSLDAVNWATLTTIASANTGTIKQLNVTAGPFGLIRIQITGGTTGNTALSVVGWEMQRES